MKPSSVPIVMFKKGLGLKSDLKTSNYLKGIIFTGSLREILIRYIFDSDTFLECEIREDYIRHFKSLTKEPFPKKHPFRKLKNVIFSPHRAGALDIAFKNMGEIVIKDIRLIAKKLQPNNCKKAELKTVKKITSKPVTIN